MHPVINPRANGLMPQKEESLQWVFIVGVNNSGTTMLSALLDRHPELTCLPREGHIVSERLPKPWAHGVGRVWTERTSLFRMDETTSIGGVDAGTIADSCKADWLASVPGHGRIVIEKTPPNALRIPWLERHFAPAKFIYIVRDPVAVAEGICRRNGVSPQRAVNHWVKANQICFTDLAGVEQKMQISYRQMSRRPLETLNAIGKFLEIKQPFDESMIDNPFEVPNADGRTSGIIDFDKRSYESFGSENIRLAQDIAQDFYQSLIRQCVKL